MAGRAGRRGFGAVRKLPSGRWQASYLGPDGKRYTARRPDGGPLTFDTKDAADGWLSLRRSEILRNAWLPTAAPETPISAKVVLGTYAWSWLATRRLAQTTRDHYAQVLRDHIEPAFGTSVVTDISPAAVRAWHASLATGPTAKAHAYGLLRTILATAVADEVITANPCRVRGAGQSKRAKNIRPATLSELETIAATVPAKYKAMVLMAAWCALRFGELAELRRDDIDVKNGIVHVRRGVTRKKGGRVVGDPKSEAGKRSVAIPPHLMPAVKDHLSDHVAAARDALVFPAASGGHLAPATLYRVFYPARDAAGRPDLRFHDLRHTGATLAAVSGATLRELMARLGHSTPAAAMRYQHAADDRDKAIAEALSKLATVTPITAAKATRKRKEASG